MTEFTIEVVRIGYSVREITVLADNQADAERLALDEAGSHYFDEHCSEYKLSSDLPASGQPERTEGV